MNTINEVVNTGAPFFLNATSTELKALADLARVRSGRNDMIYKGSERDAQGSHHFFASYGCDEMGKRERVIITQQL